MNTTSFISKTLFVQHVFFFLLSILFIFASCFFVLFPVFAVGSEDILQQGGGYLDTDVPLPQLENDYDADEKVNSIIYAVIEIILALSGFVAVILLILGGVRYTISTGDDDMISGARSMILYALMGLFVVIFSYAILKNILYFLEV